MTGTTEPPVVVLGVGAIGGTTGGALLRAGQPVVLVDQWYQNVETIRRDGISVTNGDEAFTTPGAALYLDQLDQLPAPVETVLLCSKSYDTVPLMRAIEPYLAADGVVVSMQNGINEDRIAGVIGRERTVGCVVHYGAAMFDPADAIRYGAPDWLAYTVGELDGGETERLSRIVTLLAHAGRTESTDDIFGERWAKLILNCMSNCLTAMSGKTVRTVWGSEVGVRAMAHLGGEAVAVCRAQGRTTKPVELYATGAKLDGDLLFDAHAGDAVAFGRVRELLFAEAETRKGKRDNVSSMLQDVQRGRRPEIDYLNGYLVHEGRARGVDVTVNRQAVTRLGEVLSGGREQRIENLEDLAP